MPEQMGYSGLRPTSVSAKRCPACGKIVGLQAAECTECGHRFRTQFQEPADRTEAFDAVLKAMQKSSGADGLVARAANRHLGKSGREAAAALPDHSLSAGSGRTAVTGPCLGTSLDSQVTMFFHARWEQGRSLLVPAASSDHCCQR